MNWKKTIMQSLGFTLSVANISIGIMLALEIISVSLLGISMAFITLGVLFLVNLNK